MGAGPPTQAGGGRGARRPGSLAASPPGVDARLDERLQVGDALLRLAGFQVETSNRPRAIEIFMPSPSSVTISSTRRMPPTVSREGLANARSETRRSTAPASRRRKSRPLRIDAHAGSRRSAQPVTQSGGISGCTRDRVVSPRDPRDRRNRRLLTPNSGSSGARPRQTRTATVIRGGVSAELAV